MTSEGVRARDSVAVNCSISACLPKQTAGSEQQSGETERKDDDSVIGVHRKTASSYATGPCKKYLVLAHGRPFYRAVWR